MGKGIRKQVYDLTAEDLTKFPVWEFALDEEGDEEQNEATVRPMTGSIMPDDLPAAVVRAKFVLADGSVLIGHMTVPGIGPYSLDDLHPSIVTKSDQVTFLYGFNAPSAAEKERFYALIGKSPEQVFPIQFSIDIEQLVPPLTETIPGFMFLKKRFLLSPKTLITV